MSSWIKNNLTIETPKTMTKATDASPMTMTATAQGGRKSSLSDEGLGWGSLVLTTRKIKHGDSNQMK